MLPFVTNSALGGSVQLAAFVQDKSGQTGGVVLTVPSRSSSCSSLSVQPRAGSRPAAGAACGLLVVASACCPPRPRSGRLQVCSSRSKTRRRRSGSSGRGDSGDSDLGGDWPLDSFFWGGRDDSNNNGSGSGGNGGWHRSWDPAGDDAFHQAVYHGMWLWQLLCAASLVRSLYFLMFSESVVAHVDAVRVGGGRLEDFAMAC